jgi:hypothetical protein
MVSELWTAVTRQLNPCPYSPEGLEIESEPCEYFTSIHKKNENLLRFCDMKLDIYSALDST